MGSHPGSALCKHTLIVTRHCAGTSLSISFTAGRAGLGLCSPWHGISQKKGKRYMASVQIGVQRERWPSSLWELDGTPQGGSQRGSSKSSCSGWR